MEAVANGLQGIGDTSANTLAGVASNKATTRQDGKTYKRRIDGKWKAEKNALGREKVDRDKWVRPRIERALTGGQIIPPEQK